MTENTKIPQVCPWLGEEEKLAVMAVIEDKWLTEGPRSQALQQRLNELIGVPYGVFAPNGTLALVLGLLALGVGQGQEVIVPNTTFIGSANAVLLAGATPVFVDVEPNGFQIDVTKAEDLITDRTAAIMPVHLFGAACDMTSVLAFANRHNIVVIEDAAQGIGITYGGTHVGGIGDVGCFSFFADKTLTMGEGGYVVCRDEATYKNLLMLRNQGRLERGSFIHPAIGYNFRITDMQAAVGLCQLDRLETIIERKGTLFEVYKKGLEDVEQVRLLGAEGQSSHVPFRCVLICERVKELSAYLDNHGVETRGFFYPLHMQPCFLEDGKVADDSPYPNSIYGYEHGVCLPIFPMLEPEQVERITRHIRDFYA